MDNAYNTDNNKKAMLEALEMCYGIVSNACRMVKISRQTHYEWYRNDEDYKAKVDELKEVAIDFVESQLFKSIQLLEPGPMIFYLKTKAKHRGYIERNELNLSGSIEIKKPSWFEDPHEEMSYLLPEQILKEKTNN